MEEKERRWKKNKRVEKETYGKTWERRVGGRRVDVKWRTTFSATMFSSLAFCSTAYKNQNKQLTVAKSSNLVRRVFPTSITSSKAKAWKRVWSSSLLTDITILRDSRTSASTSSVDCVAMVSKPSMTFGRNGVRISVLFDSLRWAQNLQWSIQKYHHAYSFQRNPFKRLVYVWILNSLARETTSIRSEELHTIWHV